MQLWQLKLKHLDFGHMEVLLHFIAIQWLNPVLGGAWGSLLPEKSEKQPSLGRAGQTIRPICRRLLLNANAPTSDRNEIEEAGKVGRWATAMVALNR